MSKVVNQCRNRLRDLVRADFMVTPSRAEVMLAIIEAGARQQRQQIVFRWVPGACDPRGDCFEIYRTGDEPHRFRTTKAGVWPAWCVMADRGFGDSLRARDFAEPGATTDKAVSRAIRQDAASWFAYLGFPELEAACKCIHLKGGLFEYEPAGNAPRIKADTAAPTWAPAKRIPKAPRPTVLGQP
ncbi:MAG: hypothetical protein CMK85_04555 [Pseudomonadales bacterium]|nr:hypothetical protein [Pseudomonadales bacterium]